MQTQQGRPWWKEPWPWLLMSGPLLAMIGCGVTIWLAAQHADRPVEEAVHRGLVVNAVKAAADAGNARQP